VYVVLCRLIFVLLRVGGALFQDMELRPVFWMLFGDVFEEPYRLCKCNTGKSGQLRSIGNIELVRFLNSYKGDGVHVVFASVQLLYRNNIPHDHPSKFTHR